MTKHCSFALEPFRWYGPPYVCTLTPTNMEIESNHMEAEVTVLVTAASFSGFCVFWLSSTWSIPRHIFWFRWKAASYSCHAQRSAPLLRHSAWRGMLTHMAHRHWECNVGVNAKNQYHTSSWEGGYCSSEVLMTNYNINAENVIVRDESEDNWETCFSRWR